MKTVIAALLLSIFFLSTASAQDKHVHTTRRDARQLFPPKSADVWHFAIYGDRTGGPAKGIEILKQAVVDTNLLDPDLVMTVGDLVQGYNETPQWLKETREFQGVMGNLRMPWYPVAGNHDVYFRGKGRPNGGHELNYEEHFGPLWYWFRHKNAAFIVLYSDEGDPKDNSKGFKEKRHTQMSQRQLNWLSTALKANASMTHVFCFLHHPRWWSEYYKGTNWKAVHSQLAAAGNVRAVFAGHIHRMRYEGTRDGIEYHALAATGGGLGHDLPKAGYLHHMDVVTVRKNRFTIAALPIGAVIDPKTFDATRYDEITLLLKGRGERIMTYLPLALRSQKIAKFAIELSNPTGRSVEFTTEFSGLTDGLTVTPDHEHVTIKPGGKRTLSFKWSTSKNGVQTKNVRLQIHTDYLAADTRVTLPVRNYKVIKSKPKK